MTKEKIRDIRHEIEERLAAFGVNVTGSMDNAIDTVLKKHLPITGKAKRRKFYAIISPYNNKPIGWCTSDAVKFRNGGEPYEPEEPSCPLKQITKAQFEKATSK